MHNSVLGRLGQQQPKTGEFEQLLEASPAKAWADSIQQHWKTLAPQLEANASADAVQRMLEMGKVYMGFAENACKVPHSSVVSAETVDTWLLWNPVFAGVVTTARCWEIHRTWCRCWSSGNG